MVLHHEGIDGGTFNNPVDQFENRSVEIAMMVGCLGPEAAFCNLRPAAIHAVTVAIQRLLYFDIIFGFGSRHSNPPLSALVLR
jgi:hypothetical protein